MLSCLAGSINSVLLSISKSDIKCKHMDITYLGHSSFRIHGKSATVITDPFDPTGVGLKFPKHTEADVVTVSHEHKDHNAIDQIEGSPIIVRGAGEYDVKGVGIVGIGAYHDEQKGSEHGKNTLYRIEIDGISIVHTGDLGHMLSAQDIDTLDGVNVLMVCVGGGHSLDASKAIQLINEIEPSIVIPMHYGRKELSQSTFGHLAPLDVFLKEIGKPDVTAISKLVLTKDKLPVDTQVVVLE